METAAYHPIQPPVRTLRLRELSKRELREYDRWFHEVTPERVGELADFVRRSPGFEHWRPDYSRGSLDSLGRWLATKVETRQRTQEELDEIASRLPHREYVSQNALTDRTISLAYDVGMYLGEVLVRNNPTLGWDQIFGSKRFIDYGRPVIVGFRGKVPFNPVGMLLTYVGKLERGTDRGRGLRELYDVWINLIA